MYVRYVVFANAYLYYTGTYTLQNQIFQFVRIYEMKGCAKIIYRETNTLRTGIRALAAVPASISCYLKMMAFTLERIGDFLNCGLQNKVVL